MSSRCILQTIPNSPFNCNNTSIFTNSCAKKRAILFVLSTYEAALKWLIMRKTYFKEFSFTRGIGMFLCQKNRNSIDGLKPTTIYGNCSRLQRQLYLQLSQVQKIWKYIRTINQFNCVIFYIVSFKSFISHSFTHRFLMFLYGSKKLEQVYTGVDHRDRECSQRAVHFYVMSTLVILNHRS